MDYQALITYLDQVWTRPPAGETVADYPFHELRALLEARGNPQTGLTIVHVTGSKGKGSVTTLVTAVLRAHGLLTGKFTSPHLIHLEERIEGPGGTIGRDELANRMSDLIALSRTLGHDQRSIWRLLLIAALEHYRDAGASHAAIEVGIGGRFDATNILDGAVACITPIGLEHVPRLGNTRAEIAAQKVAIVKPGRVCISAPQSEDVQAVIAAGVALASARQIRLDREAGFTLRAVDRSGSVLDVRTPYALCEGIHIGLLGRHQAENAAIAVTAAEQVLTLAGRHLDPGAVRTGLEAARWPGRLEILRHEPPVLYDGAHTGESAAAAAQALVDHFPGVRWTFVVGMLTRRDVDGMLTALGRVAERVIFVPVPGFDAIDTAELNIRGRGLGLVAETAPDVPSALERVGGGPTCVTGTLYLYAATRDAVRSRHARVM